jgi:hypothetical protein
LALDHFVSIHHHPTFLNIAMISNKSLEELSDYWQRENVACSKAVISSHHRMTDLALLFEQVGMPDQEWWLFTFLAPSMDEMQVADITFGTIGRDWSIDWLLQYRISTGECVMIDDKGEYRFVNASILQFMRTLIEFDKCYRAIRQECPGDSGAAWDRGDVIIGQTEIAMRRIDAKGFERESCFWPWMLVEING